MRRDDGAVEGEVVSPAVFREGWDAKMGGASIGSNPHGFGSPRWVAWREGYADAEAERWKGLDRAAR